ncbi:TMEM165/GDT1 family protein [Sandarakinorhabdus rubra]|uniref:TMEM165/GDT1 family protein n=1 Tax=Sandarakinorhabdus rubra TaxID=2672568 RepID=UPI0013DD65D4|nr:TMEM165/GDT1 family protein [Sandarakinorhabdus rubra]
MPDLAATLFTSTGLVALAEMGDRTQLLSVLLAARYRRPVPIIAGVAVATLANHALAAWAGAALANWFAGPAFRTLVGLGFLATAAWLLVPDKPDDAPPTPRGGLFLTTLVAFFLAEIGDKTQIATIGLGARFGDAPVDVLAVTLGTTLGMMLANVPAVLLGDRLLARLPLRFLQRLAAVLMAALGLAMVWQAVGPLR